MLIAKLIAAGGLLFAFEHATIAGKLVLLLLLAIGSIFSWSVMITKMRVIQFARKQNARFLAAFGKIDNHCVCSRKMRVFPVRRISMSIAPVAAR